MRTIGEMTMDGIVIGHIEIEHGPAEGEGHAGLDSAELWSRRFGLVRPPQPAAAADSVRDDAGALFNKRFGFDGPDGRPAGVFTERNWHPDEVNDMLRRWSVTAPPSDRDAAPLKERFSALNTPPTGTRYPMLNNRLQSRGITGPTGAPAAPFTHRSNAWAPARPTSRQLAAARATYGERLIPSSVTVPDLLDKASSAQSAVRLAAVRSPKDMLFNPKDVIVEGGGGGGGGGFGGSTSGGPGPFKSMPPASAPMGSLRAPLKAPRGPSRNAPGEIDGRPISGHAIDQMQNRGITPNVVDQAVKSNQQFPERDGTVRFYDPINNISVLVNPITGNIISVWPGE
jgi:hypothetical protein